MSVVSLPNVPALGMKTEPDGSAKSSPGKAERQKFSITLSGKTAALFEELKALTDADTDSEVFRNALRAHYMLLKAHESGFTPYFREANSGTLHPVILGQEQFT